MTEIKHIITEHWEEEILRNIVGDEEIAKLKYPPTDLEDTNLNFNPETEYLEITIKKLKIKS